MADEMQTEGPDQSLNDFGEPTVQRDGEGKGTVKRGEPQISPQREALVKKWVSEIRADKKHWKDTFSQMRRDQDFAYGKQWSERSWDDDRYTVNITLRHIQQRVASLYAKNPTVVARRKEKLMSTVWDGTMSGIMMAMTQMQNFNMQAQAGLPMDPQMQMQMQQPMQVLQEAQQEVAAKAQMDKFAKTLELLYEYNVDEQAHPFKSMLKLTVRRAATVGVGYVKLGFQRVMQMRPEIEEGIADVTRKLAEIERVSNAAADEKIPMESAEMEQLRLQLENLQSSPEQIVREGLVFDYPDSTAIIPDRKIRQLRNFLGADYVTQEYVLTPEEIEKVYGVDIGDSYRAYRPGTTNDPNVSPIIDIYEHDTDRWSFDEGDGDKRSTAVCLVWETYDRNTGLVYVTCDGYKDFLQEPDEPEVWTENFYPWYPIVLNECDHPSKVFPPSDVQLIRHQQMEYNRLREGLREHRISNRPATIVAGGMLSEADGEKMVNRPANALIELDGLQLGQSVDQLLQGFSPPGVDPNLYEVNGIFEDVLRAVGVQEANLGGTGGITATETSVAEAARQSSLQSNVDDLDDMLTRLARASGQILLANVSEETVKETVGPGAMWPEMTREQLAKEIFLEIEAGSTGRPNQAQEIQNFERLAPILMQVPGVTPEMLAKEGIRRLDDRMSLSDMYDPNQVSIQAMNQMAGAMTPPGQGAGQDPSAQGGQGAVNAEQPGSPAGASSAGMRPPPNVQ